MLMGDYSQLPVMQGERTIIGVVSWKTIGRKSFVEGGHAEFVRDCMDEHVSAVGEDRPLFEILDTLVREDFVLVLDKQKRVTGIVTMSDVGEQFREVSEPYLLLGAIENQIRRLIAGRFSLEQLRAVRAPGDTRTIDGLFDLTFAEYTTLLASADNWRRLRLSIDRNTFVAALDGVRRIRNDVMHFDPTLEEQGVQELRNFARLLRAVSPIRSVEATPTPTKKA